MDPFTDGTPPFRGTCRVLLEAILSQSLNVIVATYYLTGGETSTNQNNTTSNPGGMDTTTVYRVDHLLSSRVENHRNPSHTLSSFFRDDETPVHSTAPPAGGPLLTSLYSSSEEARATLATSHQYSLLTAIHLLRCPCATRIVQSICQHSSHNSRSAILAEQVQSLFQRHPTWPPDAAVYLYRYTYNRFSDATTTYNRASDRVEHSVRHNEALLSLLKTAINTEAYVTYPGAGASPLDKGRKRYTRTVTVTPLLLQVFPEVEPNHQASQSGDRWPVDYNCPHCWHRHTLLQYVLDSVLEEHAVVFADRSLLEKSFRQWRERYGWRVIHKIKGLVLDGEQEAEPYGSGSVESPHLSPPLSPAETSVPRHNNLQDVSSIASNGPFPNHSLQSEVRFSAFQTQENTPLRPLYYTSSADEVTIHHGAPEPPHTSPDHVAHTAKRGQDSHTFGNDNSLEHSHHSNTVRTLRPTLEEVLYNSSTDPSRHDAPKNEVALTLGGDLLQSPSLSTLLVNPDGVQRLLQRIASRHVRDAFYYWRDVKYAEAICVKYTTQQREQHQMQESFLQWKSLTRKKLQHRKEKYNKYVLKVYEKEAQEAKRRMVFYVWKDAAAVKHFQLQTAGKRVFTEMRNKTKLQAFWKERSLTTPTTTTNRVLVKLKRDSFLTWLEAYRNRRADEFYTRHTLKRAFALFKERGNADRDAGKISALHDRIVGKVLLAKWRRKATCALLEKGQSIWEKHTTRFCFDRWKKREHTEKEEWRKIEKFQQETVFPHQAKLCWQRWRREWRMAVQLKTFTSDRETNVQKKAFQIWKKRCTFSKLMKRDLLQFADEVYQRRFIPRRYFSLWRRHHVEAIQRREREECLRMETTADEKRSRTVVAGCFFHWRTLFFTRTHYHHDTRRIGNHAKWVNQKSKVIVPPKGNGLLHERTLLLFALQKRDALTDHIKHTSREHFYYFHHRTPPSGKSDGPPQQWVSFSLPYAAPKEAIMDHPPNVVTPHSSPVQSRMYPPRDNPVDTTNTIERRASPVEGLVSTPLPRSSPPDTFQNPPNVSISDISAIKAASPEGKSVLLSRPFTSPNPNNNGNSVSSVSVSSAQKERKLTKHKFVAVSPRRVKQPPATAVGQKAKITPSRRYAAKPSPPADNKKRKTSPRCMACAASS